MRISGRTGSRTNIISGPQYFNGHSSGGTRVGWWGGSWGHGKPGSLNINFQ